MASADFCLLFLDRPPRVMRTYLPAYARHIYAHAFRIDFGL